MNSHILQHAALLAAFAIVFVHGRSPASAGETASKATPAGAALVCFAAMGDVPYQPEEDAVLARQIDELPSGCEFAVHLGDIQKGPGQTPCGEAAYERVAGLLSRCRIPLFILPGDNEWNDCPNPDDGWTFWRRHFMRFEEKWPARLGVFRQVEREENLAFLRNRVLFIGLNLVGGRVQDAQEWKRRHAENADWTGRCLASLGAGARSAVVMAQAGPGKDRDDFFEAFTAQAKAFDKPLLFIHGDGHRWIEDHPLPVPNVLRVQVDMGGAAPPLVVRVGDNPLAPFEFDRRDVKEAGVPPSS